MISLGAASNEAERAFEATLRRVAPWQGRGMRYRPVLGGISNMNWRVEIEGEACAYFVKMPGRAPRCSSTGPPPAPPAGRRR